ncbi:thioredoxin-dependent thiol peroxidase [Riemerella anatipestifer]|uniref:thioredoxin-dependent peroxiredoxin n=1 Tax=Riemerella anatipestifer (strain ATCC 11845 / DSM 15868 / JCM 9532 / NCTC 11014) TaxID=693978 RepID=E4TBV5_RIEAD|nr:thioredoxin-dependent thiol peroxidase [Riemerella anatipestifer]ADQ82002.1 alkyl hydroperoxide reductase/ Thiol specific antioxidant/ Mal allergen [Riemerella anatipestifer ATCC 11845 = DSM 15868]ADZ12499.1 Peroxiredoxin [Riemerella anatipestifer RA-GD]AFD56004.1 alkyl hydroperoxide reductase/ thiol specific antioxidant/ mal allergen [Riemerella anatipestifer ATCC 11845 = DSM 15868]AGC40085.1 Peroxiredoxin [Riemerella anatipestifer RA-CH-2]AKP69229.1 alkyl hydroperoxide reductase/ thiol sp
MINIGDSLPAFTVKNQDGKEVSASDFKGKKLVVFFYPKANTSGCTAEACNLSENYEVLQKQGYTLLGVSADSVEKQKKFHDKFNFPYDLLADEERQIIEAFGVWQLKKFMGKEFMGIVRATFIFDENGVCTRIIDKVKTKEHSAQILEY